MYLGIFYAQALVIRPSLRALLRQEEIRKTVRGYPAIGFSSITAVRRVTACSTGDRPRGQEGPYICSFICLFTRAYLFVDVRLLMLSIRVFRDIIKNYLSMLDRIGALDRLVQQSSYYREPIVVVFKISPSKIFLPPPLTPTTTTRSCPHAMRRLCVGSRSELRRPGSQPSPRIGVESDFDGRQRSY